MTNRKPPAALRKSLPRHAEPAAAKSPRPNRIKELARERNVTYAEIADGLGVHEVTIAKLSNGTTRMNEDWQRKLADFFKVAFADIMEKPAAEGMRRVHVRGKLQAGTWAEAFDEIEMYDVMVPDDSALQKFYLYAREIEGDSMNRLYPNGSVVVMSSMLHHPETPLAGKCYHIQVTRPDGLVEQTIKRFHRDPRGDEWLMPDSDSPEFRPIKLGDDGGGEVQYLGRVRFAIRRED